MTFRIGRRKRDYAIPGADNLEALEREYIKNELSRHGFDITEALDIAVIILQAAADALDKYEPYAKKSAQKFREAAHDIESLVEG